MIVPSAIERKFALVRPYLNEVASIVRDTVLHFCEDKGYAYVGRPKTSESTAEKIETGRFKCWSDLDDLVACSVIIPSLRCEADVLDFLNGQFKRVQQKARVWSRKDPQVFRFEATRFYGRLRPVTAGSDRGHLEDVVFEVQVRSAFEHAWSVATHPLAYKGEHIDWRFERLAAQLKAVVEQLDMLVVGFDDVARHIDERKWPELGAKRKIEDFFRSEFAASHIPSELAPDSWTRFCSNVYQLLVAGRAVNEDKPEQGVTESLSYVGTEIQNVGPAQFPRSISLLQFVVGVLTTIGVLRTLDRYTPLVTDELRSLFPATETLQPIFTFE